MGVSDEITGPWAGVRWERVDPPSLLPVHELLIVRKKGGDMDDSYTYRVRFDRGHALLFRLAPDRTIAMRVFPMKEWIDLLSEAAKGNPTSVVAEAGRQVFLREAEAIPQLVGAGRP